MGLLDQLKNAGSAMLFGEQQPQQNAAQQRLVQQPDVQPVMSGVFAFLVILSNAIFCCISSFSTPLYVIINGMLMLIWFLSAYGVTWANKQ